MRIPSIINEVCQELGINYRSKYDTGDLTEQDIKKLIDIYFQLQKVSVDLVEIEEKHNIINEVKKDMINAVSKLESISHLLFADAYKIKHENEEKEEVK